MAEGARVRDGVGVVGRGEVCETRTRDFGLAIVEEPSGGGSILRGRQFSKGFREHEVDTASSACVATRWTTIDHEVFCWEASILLKISEMLSAVVDSVGLSCGD